MLNSFFKGACALAAVTALSVSAAQAKEHVILIINGSYFPSVLNVEEGDLLTFKNESKSEQIVNGEDLDDEDAVSWTSGPIGIEESYTYEVTDVTPEKFTSAYDGGVETAGELIIGADEDDDS